MLLFLWLQAVTQKPKSEFLGKLIDLKFVSIDGRVVDLASLKGKVVLIDFWATWCGPCLRQLPELKVIYNRYHSLGLEVVGISFDQFPEDLRHVVTEEVIPWPQYFEPGDGPNSIAQRYKINRIPTLWLINQKGRLEAVVEHGTLEKYIKKALAHGV